MPKDIELEEKLRGALSRPSGEGVFPDVVVVHEAFGDQPEIREFCDRVAEDGYVALMPDLFKDGPLAICTVRAMKEVTSGTPGRINGYIDDARRWLAEQWYVDAERIGEIGFCMGGAFALAYVGEGVPGVRVASINYAEVPKDDASLRGACPIVSSYGGRDKMVGRSHAERLSSHLEALGIEHEVKVYDDAGHSFMTRGHHSIAKLTYLARRAFLRFGASISPPRPARR